MTKRLLFFATGNDLGQLLAAIERALPLDYVRMGHSATNTAETYAASTKLPNLGHATAGAAGTSDEFMVVLKGHPVEGRRVIGNDGQVQYFFDQLANQASITFAPGGLWEEDVLLHGRVATVSEDATSQSLMKEFAKAMRTSFRKIKAYWVGPEAETLLDAGKRLTISAQASRDFDLTRSG